MDLWGYDFRSYKLLPVQHDYARFTFLPAKNDCAPYTCCPVTIFLSIYTQDWQQNKIIGLVNTLMDTWYFFVFLQIRPKKVTF